MGNCDINSNSHSSHHQYYSNDEDSDIYRFQRNENNIFKKKELNLTFIFSQIKIKHVISHSGNRKSIYIIEIKLGKKSKKNSN